VKQYILYYHPLSRNIKRLIQYYKTIIYLSITELLKLMLNKRSGFNNAASIIITSNLIRSFDYFFESIFISTLLFIDLPSGVSFVAIGFALPYPTIFRLFFATPLLTR
jgi:hypothetical protein